MCIIFLAYRVHPQYPLILAANRDEFWRRPAEPAHFWPDVPHLLGGRDKVAGGTWLGVTRQGRVAAVTNFRDPKQRQAGRSRGELVSRFLMGHEEPGQYLEDLIKHRKAYNGYNLFVGSVKGIYYHSNRMPHDQDRPLFLSPGIYGLSNHLLDTPWFKVEKGKRILKEILSAPSLSPNQLFELLADQEQAPDHRLPETGIGYKLEKKHSAIFIKDIPYGTRCSTLVLVNRQSIWYGERSFTPDYTRFVERTFVFPVDHVVI